MKWCRGVKALVAVAVVVALLVGIGLGYGVSLITSGSAKTVTVTKSKVVTTTVLKSGTAPPPSVTTVTKTVTQTVTKSVSGGGGVKVYKIGFTLPLSGQLSSVGKLWKYAAEMAIKDLNKEVQAYGFNVRFEAVILDDKTTDEGALNNIKTLHQLGINVIIGPAASSQVKAVKSYVDANKIVVISPSSTAPTLAIPNDYIFRFTGSDALQAKALVALLKHEGVKKVVVFHRDDEYGNAFAKFLIKDAEAEGIKAYDLPYASDLSDYASEVAALSKKVQEVGADAVVLISFDTDGANILSHAKDDPVLARVRWFSSEGIHGASELLEPDLASFLIKVKFMGTRPVFIHNVLYEEFAKRFKELTGSDPPVFTEKLYDAVIVAGWAILRAGSYDGEKIKEALPEVAKHYYGVSGWCILDKNGDRLYQDYAIWTIVKEGNKYVFKDIGSYSGGSITFLS